MSAPMSNPQTLFEALGSREPSGITEAASLSLFQLPGGKSADAALASAYNVAFVADALIQNAKGAIESAYTLPEYGQRHLVDAYHAMIVAEEAMQLICDLARNAYGSESSEK